MSKDNQSDRGDAATFGWCLLRWLGRFFKKLAIYTLVFIIGAQIILFALNLYDRTLGAPTFEGPPIPYKQLASEKSHPIKYDRISFRKDLIPGSFWFYVDRYLFEPDWSMARGKFLTVRSCLHYTERDKEKPDLRKVDWSRMGSQLEINICLFRIFASLGTVDGAIAWLKTQGASSNPHKTNIHTDDLLGEKVAVPDNLTGREGDFVRMVLKWENKRTSALRRMLPLERQRIGNDFLFVLNYLFIYWSAKGEISVLFMPGDLDSHSLTNQLNSGSK